MKIAKGVSATVEMTVVTRQICAKTGKVVSESAPRKNLVMNRGLNALARSSDATYPAEMFSNCVVGSGSTSDKISSGAVTFTQSGTTLTASAPFFTAGMVGMLFKWGTGSGGDEVYITSYTSSTSVEVDTPATVAVPEVGVVWNVIRTQLENYLYQSNSYQTATGDNETTYSGPTVTHKRTFNFAQQVAPYNVNEVGYFRSASGNNIFGRLVLPATEVVNPTNFLQVVLTLQVTYSPASPTPVPDVGTNIDTSGNAMIEGFRNGTIGVVLSSGASQAANNGQSGDGSNTAGCRGLITNYTQASTPAGVSGTNCGSGIVFQTGNGWFYNGTLGQMRVNFSNTITTSGQTLYGVCIGREDAGNTYPTFDVKFSTPFVLPTGSFLPQVSFLVTYGRTLTN